MFKTCVNLIFGIFLVLLSLVANAVEVSLIDDIRQESQLAQQNNRPILIIFSSDYCPFCELVKEDFLKPMLISGDYTDRVIIREVNIDAGTTLVDFNGQNISSDSFAYRYHVSLFPTMVMLNYQGKTLSHRILGVNTPEMFGGRIDQMIEVANQELQQKITKNNR